MITKRIRVRVMEPVRAYTTDAPRRSHDATLSAVVLGSREEREFTGRTGSVIGLNSGMVWDGDWRARLDRMSPASAMGAVSDRMVTLGRSTDRSAARQIRDLADYLT
jgi:hypothetical protein